MSLPMIVVVIRSGDRTQRPGRLSINIAKDIFGERDEIRLWEVSEWQRL